MTAPVGEHSSHRHFERPSATGTSHSERGSVDHRIALVGTYPPTRCGIGFFTASLRNSIETALPDTAVDVVRVLQDGSDGGGGPEVIADLEPNDAVSIDRVGDLLSEYRVVLLQHEFGIYGHGHGRNALELVRRIEVPLITTMHTVTDDPFDTHVEIVLDLVAHSDRIVVMSEVARSFLEEAYGVDPDVVEVIPHGSHHCRRARTRDDLRLEPSGPRLLNWGLIGPGKGLVWAILAVDLLRERFPTIEMVIAGRTHPKVLAREGERYRASLEEMTRRLALGPHVEFIPDYLTREQLDELLGQASVVVLPYNSTHQTSSGVLIEAISAGVPVVATAFPQALEMADRGAAKVVPHQSAEELARAIAEVLDNPDVAAGMLLAQAGIAEAASWAQVGRRYAELIEDVSQPAVV